jgi:hypothetical protein
MRTFDFIFTYNVHVFLCTQHPAQKNIEREPVLDRVLPLVRAKKDLRLVTHDLLEYAHLGGIL